MARVVDRRLRPERRPELQRRRDRRLKRGETFNECPAVADHFAVPRESLQQEAIRNMSVRGSALPKKPLCTLAHRFTRTLRACSACPARGNLLRQQRSQPNAQNHGAHHTQQAAALPSA